MPRKKPIRTLAQMNAANAKNNRRRAKTLARITKSDFVAELSKRFFRRYAFRIKTSSPSEQIALFKLMPQYETVVAFADKIKTPFRKRFAQKARARRPRKHKAYPIGPRISDGPHRLPLVLDAFIEEHVRASSGLARDVWNGLDLVLNIIATCVELHNDPKDPRADFYTFTLFGDTHFLKYGQFEKIFTFSRKPRRTDP